MDCPDDDALARFVQGGADRASDARLQKHVDGCAKCFAVLRDYAIAFGSAAEPTGGPRGRPQMFGRYAAVGELGRGGMGTVFEAVDAVAKRRVAIKVLHARDDDTRDHLQREARALARLSHPNVVQVFDVGEEDGDAYMVTELVEGDTLDDWLARAERSWQEIVAVFVGVAAGLQAAHAVELVHRDVKPRNIIVDDDGTGRVMDFGLARAGPGATAPASTPTPPEDGRRSLARLTQSGALVGTPAYMAPEQLRGEPATPRSDQFSLCVALFEALCGQRPFPGTTMTSLQHAIEREAPLPWATTTPRSLRRIVARGLRAKPTERWRSMRAFADALGRRSGLAGMVAVGALATAALTAVAVWPNAQTDCEREEGLDAVWSNAERRALRTSFEESELPSASDQFAAVSKELDAYASGWAEQRAIVCAASEPAPQLACLSRNRARFVATLWALSSDDPEAVARAMDAAGTLGDPAACDPQTELPEGVDAVLHSLDAVDALIRVGRFADAEPVARDAVAAAVPVGFAPVQAKARLRLSSILDELGRYDEAAEEGRASAFAAMAGSDDGTLLRAATLLLTIASRLELADEGKAWARQADAASERLGRPAEQEAARLSANGTLLVGIGQAAEGRDLLEQAADQREAALGAKHPKFATTLANLALALETMGELRTAFELSARALAIRREVLAADHPDLATAMNNHGVSNYYRGEHDAANTLLSEALEIRNRVLGPEHPMVGTTLFNLGNVAFSNGEFETALGYFERGLPLMTSALGNNHRHHITGLLNTSRVLSRLGRFDEAEVLAERALATAEASSSDSVPEAHHVRGVALLGHQQLDEAAAAFKAAIEAGLAASADPTGDTSQSMHMLGTTLYGKGDMKAALPWFERALAGYQAVLHPEAVEIANVHTAVGAVHTGLGDPVAALPHLEHALSIIESHNAMPGDVAATRAYLAHTLLEAERDRPRARALLEQARGYYVKAGALGKADLAEVDGLLKRARSTG